MTTQTADTIRQRMDLSEALTRIAKSVTVEDMLDNGEWIARTYADEKTAADHEATMKRRSVPTRRQQKAA